MARRVTKGTRQVAVEIAVEMADAMGVLARANQRTVREEYEHAVRRHLARPPVAVVTTPEIEDATVEVAAPAPKRPRKPHQAKAK